MLLMHWNSFSALFSSLYMTPLLHTRSLLLVSLCSCLPSALGIRCADPGTPSDGTRQLLDTVVGAMVTYSCHKGYRLSGDVKRTCQADTTWTGSLPVCQSRRAAALLQRGLNLMANLLQCLLCLLLFTFCLFSFTISPYCLSLLFSILPSSPSPTSPSLLSFSLTPSPPPLLSPVLPSSLQCFSCGLR